MRLAQWRNLLTTLFSECIPIVKGGMTVLRAEVEMTAATGLGYSGESRRWRTGDGGLPTASFPNCAFWTRVTSLSLFPHLCNTDSNILQAVVGWNEHFWRGCYSVLFCSMYVGIFFGQEEGEITSSRWSREGWGCRWHLNWVLKDQLFTVLGYLRVSSGLIENFRIHMTVAWTMAC